MTEMDIQTLEGAMVATDDHTSVCWLVNGVHKVSDIGVNPKLGPLAILERGGAVQLEAVSLREFAIVTRLADD